MIRADASQEIGAGHIMRMLALAQFLSDDGYDVHFATIPRMSHLVDRLRTEGFEVHCLKSGSPWDPDGDAEQILSLASRLQPAWVVLDGYHFGPDYEREIKKAGWGLLRIVDIPRGEYHADIILNPNYGAEKMAYSAREDARILAGLKYALLRREFREAAPAGGEKKAFHVLITMGNAPAYGLNQRIVEGLSGLCGKDLSITVVAGQGEGAGLAAGGIEIKSHCDNMADEMSRADLAVVSGGSTMWELMSMQVPFLAVSLTEEQRNYLPRLARDGLCIDLGWHEDLTADHLRQSLEASIRDAEGRRRMKEKYRGLINREILGRDILAAIGEKVKVS